MTIILFILLGFTVFALLLALQMRWMISVALRRALSEKFGGLLVVLRFGLEAF